ncbi:MAG: response regulator [Phycisphaerae bacterium]|nr:response regulator [Phycisphaerae bacterium]
MRAAQGRKLVRAIAAGSFPQAVIAAGPIADRGLIVIMCAKDQRPVVLLVEDNPQNLELLQAYLEDVPEVRVLTATNGLEAMRLVAEESPAIVLLDIMMPKMSGFEVCKRIKSDPATRDIVVIMITALNEPGDVERAAECGTDDYLSKPIDRRALVEQIRNILSART